MHKINLLLFILGLPFQIYSQTVQVDSIIIRQCHDNTNNRTIEVDSFSVNDLLMNTTSYGANWAFQNQTLFSYSTSNELLSKINRYFYNSVWNIDQDWNWQYSNADSLTNYAMFSYYQGVPGYGYGEQYFYDSQNRRTEYVSLQYSSSTHSLINDSRLLYTYDSVANSIITTYQDFDTTISGWNNVNRSTIFLNASGKTDHVISELWNNNAFVYNSTKSYYYLPNDSIDFISTKNLSLSDSSIIQYSYDVAGYLTTFFTADLSNGVVTSVADSSNNFYDNNHNLIATSYYSLDPFSLALCDSSSSSYDFANRVLDYYSSAHGFCGHGGNSYWKVYDINGNIDSMNACSWTMGTSFCNTCQYQYQTLTGIANPEATEVFSIYPNPASDEIIIHYPNLNGVVLLKIIDGFGRTVRDEIIDAKETKLEVGDLPAGIYFVTSNDNFCSPVKLIKF